MEQGRRVSEIVQRDRNVRMPNLPKRISAAEKQYLLAVERGDLASVRRLIQTHRDSGQEININCMDPLGRTALLMAIESEQFLMVELLVVMGVKTADALLHAIEQEFVEAVELLLEHEELFHSEGDPYSWENIDRDIATFTPEITPLILAAHRNNYEILKILLDRGATLPMPHDIRCTCDDCFRGVREDSLRHSASRINSYKALASPSLIALTSVDPLLTAFELSWELKQLSFSENEFRGEYLELRMRSQSFAVDLLSHVRTSHELEVMLNYDPFILKDDDDMNVEELQSDEGRSEDGLARLRLAINYKQKKFVAHPWVQQLLGAIWYDGLPGFRQKTTGKKCIEIVRVIVSFPFYCLWYMIAPKTSTGKLLRKPFMKFLIHSSAYLFFLLLLILVSQRVEDQIFDWWESHKREKYLDGSTYRKVHRGNPPRYLELILALYLMGFLWEEARELSKHGFKAYTANLWNTIEVLRNFLYVMVLVLRIWSYLEQRHEITMDPEQAYIPKEQWDDFDPQLIAEGLFAAANIFSALKLVHISSIDPHLGPLQISLGRMVVDILKFFFFYSLVLFAFSCGLNQLLWYFAELEREKCYSLPGGLPDWNKNAESCMKWRRFGNLFESSQSLFWASFGMVGLADFELAGIKSYTRFWALLMFGSYSVINVIVLLNLLIAMMSNSYATITEKADTEWKFARTKLWLTYFDEDATLPSPFNLFPTFKQLKRLLFRCLPNLTKKHSVSKHKEARSADLKEQAREYTAVMRALVWRYISGQQRKAEENPVTEDDINEVKTEISTLRYDIFEVFRSNGYQVDTSNKKCVPLSKKTREWERRLFRGYHVAPAAGDENALISVQQEAEKHEASEGGTGKGADRFRSLARLALLNKDRLLHPPKHLAHIGRSNSSDSFKTRQSLKKAIANAKRTGLRDRSPSPPIPSSSQPNNIILDQTPRTSNSKECGTTVQESSKSFQGQQSLSLCADSVSSKPSPLSNEAWSSQEKKFASNLGGSTVTDIPSPVYPQIIIQSIESTGILTERNSTSIVVNSTGNDLPTNYSESDSEAVESLVSVIADASISIDVEDPEEPTGGLSLDKKTDDFLNLHTLSSSLSTGENLSVVGQKIDGVKTIKRPSAGGSWF